CSITTKCRVGNSNCSRFSSPCWKVKFLLDMTKTPPKFLRRSHTCPNLHFFTIDFVFIFIYNCYICFYINCLLCTSTWVGWCIYKLVLVELGKFLPFAEGRDFFFFYVFLKKMS